MDKIFEKGVDGWNYYGVKTHRQLAFNGPMKIEKEAENNGVNGHSRLTYRQSVVLIYLSSGQSYREIAELLKISPRTVEKHSADIQRKLGARNIPHAIILAVKQGYFDGSGIEDDMRKAAQEAELQEKNAKGAV